MKTINNSYQKINNDEKITLAIGNFDGIHLGHQNIIKKALAFEDTKTAVMTFYPHPQSVLTNSKRPFLMDNHDKKLNLKKLGVDLFFIVKFDLTFSKLSVDEFINFLKKINVKRLIIGKDFRFAHRGRGSYDDLLKHFEVVLMDDLLFRKVRVSSTYIKSLLDLGNIKLANTLLTRSYAIHGKIVHGNKVGTTLGYPTANIDFGNYYLPKTGVYATRIKINDKIYLSTTSLGHNPTINYSSSKKLESYIIDFDEMVYGKEVTVYFDHYLRDELKFDKLDDLLLQMKKDVNHTKLLVKNNLNMIK
ncbi:MAG: bifunctional riboflavin kinase/FAD synthetase [Acholeplasmataceae bacterium]